MKDEKRSDQEEQRERKEPAEGNPSEGRVDQESLKKTVDPEVLFNKVNQAFDKLTLDSQKKFINDVLREAATEVVLNLVKAALGRDSNNVNRLDGKTCIIRPQIIKLIFDSLFWPSHLDMLADNRSDFLLYCVEGASFDVERAVEAMKFFYNFFKTDKVTLFKWINASESKNQLLTEFSLQIPCLAIELAIREKNYTLVGVIASRHTKTGMLSTETLFSWLKWANAEKENNLVDCDYATLIRRLSEAYLSACSNIILQKKAGLSAAREKQKCLNQLSLIGAALIKEKSCSSMIVSMIVEMIRNAEGKIDRSIDDVINSFKLQSLFIAPNYSDDRWIFSSGPKYITYFAMAYLQLNDRDQQRFERFRSKKTKEHEAACALVETLNTPKSPLPDDLVTDILRERAQHFKAPIPSRNAVVVEERKDLPSPH
jgi:hypothetical protein